MRSKPLAATSLHRIKAQPLEMVLRCLDGLYQRLHECLDRSDEFAVVTTVTVVAKGILRQRFAQALEHAVVVHDHTAVLAGINAIGASNGLHESVRLHRLVNIEGGEALHVK